MTLRTSFVASALKPTILAIGHWFRWQSSFHQTISPTTRFCILFFHTCLTYRLWINPFLHLLQNSQVICCTCCHLLFEYASGLLNSPGGGLTTSVFSFENYCKCYKKLTSRLAGAIYLHLPIFFLYIHSPLLLENKLLWLLFSSAN